MTTKVFTFDLGQAISKQLKKIGIDVELGDLDLEDLGDKIAAAVEDDDVSGPGPKIRVAAVCPGLKESVEELGKSPRDTVVMVRVDETTAGRLDAWVETGSVKSRSEAAALFIREGLKVRESELTELEEALDAVRQAKEKLAAKARQVFGEESPS